MATKLENFTKIQLKKDLPDIRPGDNVRVYQKIKEKDKEKIQAFEGLVIARKHGKGVSATITVRKVISGIGVEKIFPIHSPLIEKIEILKRGKVRRAKLYYLRKAKGKKAKLKRKEFVEAVVGEEPSSSAEASEDKKEEIVEEKPAQEEETKEESEKETKKEK